LKSLIVQIELKVVNIAITTFLSHISLRQIMKHDIYDVTTVQEPRQENFHHHNIHMYIFYRLSYIQHIASNRMQRIGNRICVWTQQGIRPFTIRNRAEFQEQLSKASSNEEGYSTHYPKLTLLADQYIGNHHHSSHQMDAHVLSAFEYQPENEEEFESLLELADELQVVLDNWKSYRNMYRVVEIIQ
jgi:hypothetical protein